MKFIFIHSYYDNIFILNISNFNYLCFRNNYSSLLEKDNALIDMH